MPDATPLPTKCITPEFIASYCAVWEKAEMPNGERKFSVSMIFPKGTDLSGLQRAAMAAAVKNWGSNKEKWPKNFRSPFRNGNEKVKGNEETPYRDAIFINAKSDNRPQIVLAQGLTPIIEQSDFYSGCKARASVNAYCYNKGGNIGIAFGLNNLMKTSDGPRLDGRSTADQDFADYAEAAPQGDAGNFFGTDDNPLG
jgi:hypothetical protein